MAVAGWGGAGWAPMISVAILAQAILHSSHMMFKPFCIQTIAAIVASIAGATALRRGPDVITYIAAKRLAKRHVITYTALVHMSSSSHGYNNTVQAVNHVCDRLRVPRPFASAACVSYRERAQGAASVAQVAAPRPPPPANPATANNDRDSDDNEEPLTFEAFCKAMGFTVPRPPADHAAPRPPADALVHVRAKAKPKDPPGGWTPAHRLPMPKKDPPKFSQTTRVRTTVTGVIVRISEKMFPATTGAASVAGVGAPKTHLLQDPYVPTTKRMRES